MEHLETDTSSAPLKERTFLFASLFLAVVLLVSSRGVGSVLSGALDKVTGASSAQAVTETVTMATPMVFWLVLALVVAIVVTAAFSLSRGRNLPKKR